MGPDTSHSSVSKITSYPCQNLSLTFSFALFVNILVFGVKMPSAVLKWILSLQTVESLPVGVLSPELLTQQGAFVMCPVFAFPSFIYQKHTQPSDIFSQFLKDDTFYPRLLFLLVLSTFGSSALHERLLSETSVAATHFLANTLGSFVFDFSQSPKSMCTKNIFWTQRSLHNQYCALTAP